MASLRESVVEPDENHLRAPPTASADQQCVAKHADRGRVDAKVRPLASLLSLEKPGARQDRKMMAHGRLASSDGVDDIAGAQLTIGSVGDEAEEPKADRIRQHFEGRGKLVGLCHA